MCCRSCSDVAVKSHITDYYQCCDEKFEIIKKSAYKKDPKKQLSWFLKYFHSVHGLYQVYCASLTYKGKVHREAIGSVPMRVKEYETLGFETEVKFC